LRFCLLNIVVGITAFNDATDSESRVLLKFFSKDSPASHTLGY